MPADLDSDQSMPVKLDPPMESETDQLQSIPGDIGILQSGPGSSLLLPDLQVHLQDLDYDRYMD